MGAEITWDTENPLRLNRLAWLGSDKGLFPGEDCQLIRVNSHGGKHVPLGALRHTHTQTFTHACTRMVRTHTRLLKRFIIWVCIVHFMCAWSLWAFKGQGSRALGARATGGYELLGVGVGN